VQKFISKYALAAHLALLAVAPLFLSPLVGEGTVATVLLWLSPLAAVWVLLEPSRRADEMLHDARVRVASLIASDPLFWFLLLAVVLAGVRALNDGVKMAYDAETFKWFLREPPLVFLPGAVPGAGRLPFAATVALTVVVLGCRHALGKSARVAFVFSCTVFAGAAALTAMALCAFGHPGARAAVAMTVTPQNASFAGTAFGLHFLGGLAGLVGAYENKWGSRIFFYSLALGAVAAGLYFFAPVPVILLYLAAALVLLAVSLVYIAVVRGRNMAFKCVASLVLAALVPTLAAFAFAPAGLNEDRLAILGDGWTFFPDGFAAARDILSAIAAQTFRDHPWIGTGLGSFPLDIKFGAAAADWRVLAPGQASALNGWWQLTAERGIVGALLFAGALGFLAATFFRRLAACFGRRFFVPLCVLGPVALLAAAAEAFFDISFLRADALLALAAFAALAGRALPAVPRPAAAPPAAADGTPDHTQQQESSGHV